MGARLECATDVRGGDCVTTEQEKSWSRSQIGHEEDGWVLFLTLEIEGQCKQAAENTAKKGDARSTSSLPHLSFTSNIF